MAQDMQRLVVSLEAKITGFQKAMDRATGVANKKSKAIESRFEKMNSKVTGIFKNFGGGLLAGVAAGGVTGIVASLRGVASSVAEIGDEAKRAGMSAQAFQEWKYVAEQNRIGVDSLVDGFKELSLRSDEFIISGAGPAAEAFARLGYSAEDLKTKLADPSALMLEMIDRLGKFDKAAQIRLADEVFGGTGGERFVALINAGADGIGRTIDEANRLGLVLSADVIAKAQEIDRAFNAISQTVSTSLKRAIVEAAQALQDFIAAFRGFEAERGTKLDERLAALGRERLDVEREIIELRSRQGSGQGAGDGIFGTSVGESTIGEAMAAQERRLEALAAEEAAVLAVVEARRQAAPAAAGTGTGWTPPAYVAPDASRDKAAAAALREAEAVRELISELERELTLVGASDLEREISNALRDAGAAATAEQRAQIVALVSALEAETTATRNATEAAEELRGIGKDVLGGVIQDLRSGTTAAEALQNALSKVADRLLDMALNSAFGLSGGLGGIGSIFGFADGGIAKNGKPLKTFVRGGVSKSAAIFGEAGAEAAVPLPDGRSIPVDLRVPQVNSAAAKPQGVHVTVGVSADGNGNLRPFVQSIAQQEAGRSSAALSKSIPQRVDQRINDRQVRKTRA